MSFFEYLIWHYAVAPIGIVRIGRNYVASAWHRFLIGRHIATLLAPWHRASAHIAGQPVTIGTRVQDAIMSPILRLVGAVIRLGVIIVGLAVQGCIILTTLLALCVWLLWPAVVAASLYWGLALLIR